MYHWELKILKSLTDAVINKYLNNWMFTMIWNNKTCLLVEEMFGKSIQESSIPLNIQLYNNDLCVGIVRELEQIFDVGCLKLVIFFLIAETILYFVRFVETAISNKLKLVQNWQ